MSFADTFIFGRPTAAPYVDGAGVTQLAAVDQPRFDHAGRVPLGLLVDAGAAMGQGDSVRLRPRDWSASASWTIVHDWNDGIADRRDAHYASDPQAMIDGCLTATGRHRRIGAAAGYLHNYSGWVWLLGARWMLQPVVAARGGAIVATRAGVALLAT